MLQRNVLVLCTLALGACADSPTSADLSPTSNAEFRGDAASARAGSGELLYGLTSANELIMFASDKPNQTLSRVMITGLMPGESVVGIDFRPSDTGANAMNDIGSLYGVTTASRLYVIDPATGAATLPVSLSTPLDGSAFGVGFNPAADRLRIHSATNQNLRVNVETGATIVDGVLAYTAGDANAGADPDLVATAYTNNDNDPATGTSLFAIDARQDVLVGFGPAVPGSGPNSGFLLTVGPLGIDAGEMTGFDISNATGTGYAVIATSASGKSVLYTLDLGTGAATRVGLLAQTSGALVGVAVKP